VGLSLKYASAALFDIGRIHKHICAENPAAAEHVRRSILKSIETLRFFPFLGKAGRRRGTREKVVPRLPYLVVYRIEEDALVILRIYHGAQKR
jgi:addiction module RelE/StbE family toxin